MSESSNLSESSLRSLRFWGGALFFFSGLTGLVYEILWTRRLNLTFGHSILAVSTVVTAYMGGLALGSALGGRWSDRRLVRGENASWFLASYGKLEGLVGLWAFLSLPLLGWVESFYLGMSARGIQGIPLYLMAFFASLVVLLPPTTAMGATLPVVSCLYSSDPRGLGRTLARLYSTNTFGAVCGVALAGFLLLPQVGLRASVAIAGVLNLLIAAISLKVSRSLRGHLEKAPAAPPTVASSGTRSWLLPLCFALTGMLSMAAQMAWTRSLTLALGSSVYAFSIILVVFLSGIAGGSALYHRWLGEREPEWRHLAALTAGVGLSSLLAIPVLGWLPLMFLYCFPLVRDHYWQVMLLDLALSSLVLIVPTLLMGLSFPLVTQIYHHHSGHLGRSVGNIYSANTLGCIVGSSVTGFVLIPQIGVQRTLELAAGGCFWVAAVYALQSSRKAWGKAAMGFMPLGLVGLLLPTWDSSLLSAGVATHGALLRTDSKFSPHKPVYYRDGLSSTVAVLMWDAGGLTMRVNGKPEASLGLPDRVNQTVLGLLPLLYCKEPKRVGIIGLGSGLTLTATASCPTVLRAECAELEPCVIEAERYFAPYNQQILKDPRVKARYADGRTMIMGDAEKFDALVSVPSNLWVAGIVNLYTQDFYQSCRAKLNPGGVLVQWVNLYALSPSDLETVVHTFGSVFPDAQLWALGGDLAMVGGQPNASLDLMQRYYAESQYLRQELAELGFLQPQQLLGAYACPLQFAIQGRPPVRLNTDDNPCLEYSAPFSMYRIDSYATNLQWIYGLRGKYHQLPPGIPPTPQLDLAASMGSLAYTQLHEALTPRHAVSGWPELTSLFGDSSRDPDRRKRRQEWLRLHPDWPEARMRLAQECRQGATTQETLECFPTDLSATAMPNPTERYFWYQLRAQCQLAGGKWEQALQDYTELSRLRSFSDFDAAMALCHLKLGHWAEAESFSAKALAANPYDPRAHLVEALVALHQGRTEEALKGLQRVCQDCPFIPSAWLMWASTLAKMGREAEAKRVIEDYLVYYPNDQQVRAFLKQL
ncbi:fused MFS/spermidine synthase [bacterium]|nr:fused MFS/spermidine synthase [bacterium]